MNQKGYEDGWNKIDWKNTKFSWVDDEEIKINKKIAKKANKFLRKHETTK